MDEAKRYFFCGIGGSGMAPLAMIVRARGGEVAGSDRARDQGRSSDKFAEFEAQGIALFPQDGSGLISADQILVASAAVESTVADVAKAEALGCARITRATLNADLFNAATTRIGIGGTSGKSTVTGMIGWILQSTRVGLPTGKGNKEAVGSNPTVMNGAVMRNFASSALVGGGDSYVSEVDESDGSIAQYDATVAVVTNISLDHKSLAELHALFGDFVAKADHAIINADDAESAPLLGLKGKGKPNITSFGFAESADVRATAFAPRADGSSFTLTVDGESHAVALRMAGRHNVANALAAIAATRAVGMLVADAVAALGDFAGLARRYEVVGTAHGVTVIDDFAHNPDKVAATLPAAAATPGRLLIFFQPHGYGPLRQMGAELAAAFAAGMRTTAYGADKLFVCDPVYYGGNVIRDDGAKALVFGVISGGGYAVHMARRESCGEAIVTESRPGDRIIILGARDDTLTDFAHEVLAALASAG